MDKDHQNDKSNSRVGIPNMKDCEAFRLMICLYLARENSHSPSFNIEQEAQRLFNDKDTTIDLNEVLADHERSLLESMDFTTTFVHQRKCKALSKLKSKVERNSQQLYYNYDKQSLNEIQDKLNGNCFQTLSSIIYLEFIANDGQRPIIESVIDGAVTQPLSIPSSSSTIRGGADTSADHPMSSSNSASKRIKQK